MKYWEGSDIYKLWLLCRINAPGEQVGVYSAEWMKCSKIIKINIICMVLLLKKFWLFCQISAYLSDRLFWHLSTHHLSICLSVLCLFCLFSVYSVFYFCAFTLLYLPNEDSFFANFHLFLFTFALSICFSFLPVFLLSSCSCFPFKSLALCSFVLFIFIYFSIVPTGSD